MGRLLLMSENLKREPTDLELFWAQMLRQYVTVLLNSVLVPTQANCFITISVWILQNACRIKIQIKLQSKSVT